MPSSTWSEPLAPPGAGGARVATEVRAHIARDGARLSVVATAAAVAMLPLLRHGSPANLAPVDLLIGVAIGTCLLWAGATRHRWRWPYAVATCLIMAGGAVGALMGPVPRAGAVAIVQDAVLFVWCCAVANLASSPERLRVLLATWAYAAFAWVVVLFVGLAAGLPALTGQTPSEGSRTALTFGDPNYSASYYVISLLVIWACGVPRRRGLRTLAYVLLIAAIASTGSNSGMVSLLVGCAVAAVLATARNSGVPAAVATCAALVGGGVLVASLVSLAEVQRSAHSSPHAFIRDGLGRGHKSAAQRETLRRETARLYLDGGVLGRGPVSTKTRLEAAMAPHAKEAHNDYLAALIERGVLGLSGIALLVVGLAARMAALRTAALADRFASVVPHPHALVGAVAGTLVSMAVYELLHVRHLWALLGIVAALHLWGRR
jgi:O-antigen ligase